MQILNGFQTPTLLIFYAEGHESIVGAIALALRQAWTVVKTLQEVQSHCHSTLVGMSRRHFGTEWDQKSTSRILLNTHCVDSAELPNDWLSTRCDYEYLYSQHPFDHRDLARFLAFITGQINPYLELSSKSRTTSISIDTPDVQSALPNAEIVSVGADTLQIRVDLLKDSNVATPANDAPRISFVGEQVMALRRRTALPIIFAMRRSTENGSCSIQDPAVVEKYILKAIQWGCEFIEVENWLPEDTRWRAFERRGHSKIIATFYDMSGNFKWNSRTASDIFASGARYSDVVNMCVLADSDEENYELECFRSTIESQHGHHRLSAINVGPHGALSTALNKTLTPVVHPLLPGKGNYDQLSAAGINETLRNAGQITPCDIYEIGRHGAHIDAGFVERCFNELGLPHQVIPAAGASANLEEMISKQAGFGGAHVSPPLFAKSQFLDDLSTAARTTGQVDTITVRNVGNQRMCIGDNACWKGIRSTLCKQFVPSSYIGKTALVLGNHEWNITPAVYALKSLGIGSICSIGFKVHDALALDVAPIREMEDLKQVKELAVVVSALPSNQSTLIGPLLRHYSTGSQRGDSSGGRVYVDLANRAKTTDQVAVAASLGWVAYGSDEVHAWTTVEAMRLLVDHNVPYEFVRLHSDGTTP